MKASELKISYKTC